MILNYVRFVLFKKERKGKRKRKNMEIKGEKTLIVNPSSSIKVEEDVDNKDNKNNENNNDNNEIENENESESDTPKTPETPVLPPVEMFSMTSSEVVEGGEESSSKKKKKDQLKKCKSCMPSFKGLNGNASSTSASSSSSSSNNTIDTVDPRYTYCEFCKSKHTKLVWGEYKRVTEEVSHAAAKKLPYRLRTGMWICKDAYDFLMDTTETVPCPQGQDPSMNTNTTTTTIKVPTVPAILPQDMKRSSSVLVGGSLPGLDTQGVKRLPLSSATQIGEPDRKTLKLSMDKASEAKERAESLLLSQRLLNSTITEALLELRQRNASASSKGSEENKENKVNDSENEENEEEEYSRVDMKRLDDILDKIESAQSSLVKTRSGGAFGKFSNDVFTELAGLKYSVIDFRSSLTAHRK